MNWGNIFLAGIGIQYIVASALYLKVGNQGYALTMFCYGLSCFGLVWAAQ